MNIESRKKTYFITGILLNICILLIYINAQYPMVGGDYGYFISRIIDVIAHYKNNGLSIQWFTPTFGGGLPAFPNPQHTQFFVPQFLSMVVNPWLAILISIAVVSLVGYYICYKLITATLEFDWKVGIIGSIFFISNGFYIQHLAAGHLTFLLFPLLILGFYLVFSKKEVLLNGLALGLVLAGILFSGGVHILIIFALAYLMTVPLVILLFPSKTNLKRIVAISLIGLLTSILLSSGKLYAVISFVSHFPRDFFSNQLPIKFDLYLAAFFGFLFQFIAVPSLFLLEFYRDYHTHFCEIDVSIIYPQMAFLYSGIREIVLNGIKTLRNNPRKLKRKILLISFLLIAVWFVFEFAAGYGFLYKATKEWPIINSITVRSRYTAAFLFPILILCLKPLKKFLNKTPTHAKRKFGIIYILSLCSFFIYFLVPNNIKPRTLNVKAAIDSYHQVMENTNFRITKIDNMNEIFAIPAGTSSLMPYEAVFGYKLETFKAETIQGPITLTDGEYYNMTNPYHLVYSNDPSFRRFTKDEYQMMETFASYKQPEWNIPTIQIVLNIIGVITLIIIQVFILSIII